LILLLEGRAEIVEEILDSLDDVRNAVRAWASELLALGYTEDLIDAHLTPGPLQEERARGCWSSSSGWRNEADPHV